MDEAPGVEGLPEGVTVPFTARIDCIEGEVGYITITCDKADHKYKTSVKWLKEKGFTEGDRFQCRVRDCEIVYIPLPRITFSLEDEAFLVRMSKMTHFERS